MFQWSAEGQRGGFFGRLAFCWWDLLVLFHMLSLPPEGYLGLVLLVVPRTQARQLKPAKPLKALTQNQNIVRSTVFYGLDQVVRPVRTKLVGRQTLLFEGRVWKVTVERCVSREVINRDKRCNRPTAIGAQYLLNCLAPRRRLMNIISFTFSGSWLRPYVITDR